MKTESDAQKNLTEHNDHLLFYASNIGNVASALETFFNDIAEDCKKHTKMEEWKKQFDYHIEGVKLVQNVINRLAQNSFTIKNISAVLLVALLAFIASDGNRDVSFHVAIIPVLLFWFLDAYYLDQERLFRRFYIKIISDDKISPYSMDVKPHKEKTGWIKAVFSRTLVLYYGGLSSIVAVITLYQ